MLKKLKKSLKGVQRVNWTQEQAWRAIAKAGTLEEMRTAYEYMFDGTTWEDDRIRVALRDTWHRKYRAMVAWEGGEKSWRGKVC